MKSLVSNSIKIHNPNKNIIDFCKKELVLDNPDYLSAVKMGRYSRNIPTHIYLYERNGDEIVIPFGCLKRIYPLIKDYPISLDFKAIHGNSMKGNINLYDYQKNAVQRLKQAKNGILKAPCGSGKTQMGIALINELSLKTLWLTHTSDLLSQSKKRAEMYFKGDFGTITDGKVDIGRDITFATVQTMSKLDLSQYRYEFDCIIVDECHRCAGSPTRLSQFYKVVNSLSCRYKYGLSATIHRADNLIKSTFAILGDVVYEIDESEIGNKILKAIHKRIDLDTPKSFEYLDTDGTMIYSSLIKYLSNNEQRNLDIVNDLLNNKSHFNLILCNTIEQAEKLCKLLNDGVVIVGKTGKKKREEYYEEMRKGNLHYIFSTYSLAKEGLDIPNLDRLYYATPQKDYAIIKQSAGRIERSCDGKDIPIIYDYVDKNIGYCLGAYRKRKTLLR